MADAWNAEQYDRFKAERRQPFVDLLAGVTPTPRGRALDYGCGTGGLTIELADHLQAAEVIGVDNSPAMLAEARKLGRPGVSFVEADLASYAPAGALDVVFANASLQWAPHHRTVLARWAALLRPEGQLAVQVPANADHAAHVVADAVAHEPVFAAAFGPEGPPADPVAQNLLRPEGYAELLHALGLVDLRVQLRVYPHVLASSEDVIEWVKGTTLTRFRSRLSPADYDRFLLTYRERLLAALGTQTPYFYAFKRILFWARRPR